MTSDARTDRRARALLERLVADAAAGALRDEATYCALFPDLESMVREELAALRAPSGEELGRVGDYRLLRELGRGGQGVVWLARDERMGREVALKLLPPSFGPDRVPPAARREVEALARLDHPNLGTVYELGSAGGHAYLATRYVAGGSLSSRIAQGAEAPSRAQLLQRAASIAHLARALHVAHEAGVVHRDVKPDNVLLREDGTPVLVDFGLARADDSAMPTLTATGDLIGTPHYMAPERLRGEGRADPRGDVWSLGAVLYEWLTGRRPFEGPTLEGIARRVEREEPVDPRRLARACPRDLAVVCLTALEKRVERRYASALEMALELERVGEGRPIQARPVSVAGRVARWSSRNPAPAALVVLLALGLVATAVAARSFQRLALDEREARERADRALARSSWDQLQLLRAGTAPDRRWRMLELAEEVAPFAGDGASELPSRVELRSAVVEAHLLAGARLVQELDGGALAGGSLGRDGRYVALSWLGSSSLQVDTRWFDLATGENGVLELIDPGIPLGDAGCILHLGSEPRSLGATGFDGVLRHSAGLDLDQATRGRATRLSLQDADRAGERALVYAAFNRNVPAGVPPPPADRAFVIDVASGETLVAHELFEPIRAMAIAADGRRALLPWGPREFDLLDLERSELVYALELPAPARACHLADARAWFALEAAEGGTGRLLAFDASGEPVLDASLPAPPSFAQRLGLSPSGELLGYQDEDHRTRVLDSRDGRLLITLPADGMGGADGLSFRTEDELVVLGRGVGVRVWEIEPLGELVQPASPAPPDEGASILRTSPDFGLPLERGDGTTVDLQAPAGMLLIRIESAAFALDRERVAAVTMAIVGGEQLLDVRSLAGGSEAAGSRLLVWDASTGELIFDLPYGLARTRSVLALAADSDQVAAIDHEGVLSLFDVATQTLLLRAPVIEGAAASARFEDGGATLVLEPERGPPRGIRFDLLRAELEQLGLDW